jgi:hypothetical protein
VSPCSFAWKSSSRNASGFLVDPSQAFRKEWQEMTKAGMSKVSSVGKFEASYNQASKDFKEFQEELESQKGLLKRFREFMREYNSVVNKLIRLPTTTSVLERISDRALLNVKNSDSFKSNDAFKGNPEGFRKSMEREAALEDEEGRTDLREFLFSFLEEKFDMEFSPHFYNTGTSLSVHEFIDYFCPGAFLDGENIDLLVPKMDFLNHVETCYSVPWNDSLSLVRYFYGFRCVVGHGSADVTFGQRGVLSSVPSIVSRTNVIKGRENYFSLKLKSLQEKQRKFNPGYDFVLLMQRFLETFAFSFHQQLNAKEKSFLK